MGFWTWAYDVVTLLSVPVHLDQPGAGLGVVVDELDDASRRRDDRGAARRVEPGLGWARRGALRLSDGRPRLVPAAVGAAWSRTVNAVPGGSGRPLTSDGVT